jgi:hypothetical protein
MRDLGKIGFGVLMFMIVATGSASAAGCGNGSLDGSYGFNVRGVDNASGTPMATVGLFTADGSGNITLGQFTQSNDGTLSTATLTGTYSIGSSCTGTLTTTDSNSVVRHYFVVLSGIKRAALKIVDTDNGLTLSGDARAQGVGICGFTGKGSAYAENLSGFVGSVPEAIVGRVGTNGSGTISFGFNARALGGVVNTNPISGSYTVNSNCTGTAQIVFGIKSYNFTYVAVDAGKQYILLETDANTTVAGALTTE